jgi:hypothetical protein
MAYQNRYSVVGELNESSETKPKKKDIISDVFSDLEEILVEKEEKDVLPIDE